MKNRTWLAAATATATGAVVVASALWIDALGTGHTDGGLRAAPGTRAASPSTPGQDQCVGTRPHGSLPGYPGAEEGSPDNTPLYRVLAHIDELAAGRHSAVFTGLSVDEEHETAHVWRIPSAAFDADVCGAAEKGVTVRLYDTDVSRGDLDALAARISDDIDRWDGTFQMREVGVDERGFVRVGVDDPDRAEPVIKKAYGKELGERHLKVEHVGQAEAATAG